MRTRGTNNKLPPSTPTQRQQNIGICQALWKWTQPVRFTFVLHTLKSKPNLYPFDRVYLPPRSTALARFYTRECVCGWVGVGECVWVCIRYMQRLQKNVGKVFVPKSSPVCRFSGYKRTDGYTFSFSCVFHPTVLKLFS